MKQYILTDGRTTTNHKEFLLDLIQLRLSINKDSIPWYKHGINTDIVSIEKAAVESQLRYRVNEVLKGVEAEYNIPITLSELSVGLDGSYNLTINIYDKEETINSRY